MIDRRLIEQLDNADPNKRKTAIQQLARSKDLAAIEHLEKSARGNSDASVRDLAQKAVVFIRRHNEDHDESAQQTAAAAKPAPKPPDDPAAGRGGYAQGSIMAEYSGQSSYEPPQSEEPPVEEEPEAGPDRMPPVKVTVTEQRQRNAKGALTSAGRASFEELNGRAAKYLVEAFKQDPNLQFDAYATGLATTITGLYKPDAIKAVMDGSILELFDKNELLGKPKIDPAEKAEGDDGPPAGWGKAFVDLFTYGLINSVIVGIFVIVLAQVMIAALAGDPVIQDQLRTNNTTLAAVIDQVKGYAILGMVVYALIYGLLAIIGLLLSSFLIHVVSRMILGGNGTMADLIHRTALFLGIMTALNVVVQIAALFLPIVTNSTLGIGIWAAGFFLSIYTLMGYASRIGKAYDMGGNKGCIAMVLSNVLIAVLGFVCVVGLVQSGITSGLLIVTGVPTP